MNVTLELICVLKTAGILLDHTYVAVGVAIVLTEMDTPAMVCMMLFIINVIFILPRGPSFINPSF